MGQPFSVAGTEGAPAPQPDLELGDASRATPQQPLQPNGDANSSNNKINNNNNDNNAGSSSSNVAGASSNPTTPTSAGNPVNINMPADDDGGKTARTDGSNDSAESGDEDEDDTSEKKKRVDTDAESKAKDDADKDTEESNNSREDLESDEDEDEDEESDEDDAATHRKREKNRREEDIQAEEQATPMYPVWMEQSDAFAKLIEDQKTAHTDFDFLTTSASRMDRYVRITMYTLLKWLATLQTSQAEKEENADAKTISAYRKISMSDLMLYCRYFPLEYQQQYILRVERILNSNGLSLQMDHRIQFDPELVAKFFQPTYEPTRRQCNCAGMCHTQTDKDPESKKHCPCFNTKRCHEGCKCERDCTFRKTNSTVIKAGPRARLA